MIKDLAHRLEAIALGGFWMICAALPVDAASALGGWIGRVVGPRLAVSRKATRHIRAVFPDFTPARVDEIACGMWDNLGRVLAEYPHLETLAKTRVHLLGKEHIDAALAQPPDKGAVFFSVHAGNWEVPPTFLKILAGDRPLALMYRAPNNGLVDRMLLRFRCLGGRIAALPKSREGGAAAMRAIQKGSFLAILVDQKYNEGISVPFLGFEAMTNPFFVVLAQKYNVPLVPSCMIRKGRSASFDLHVLPPIETEGRHAEDVIADAHAAIEAFIRDHPEQWLWLHRRWPDKALPS